MAMAAPQPTARARAIEIGNFLVFYHPVEGVLHPRSSDEIAHASLALFPDDQKRHLNRLLTFAAGYLPPVIPKYNLPAEREWAIVADLAPDPLALIATLMTPSGPASESSPTGLPPPSTLARIAGQGRYKIVDQEGRSFLAMALEKPAQLGPAQQMLLMEMRAAYELRVNEPFAPSGIPIPERANYPDELGQKFAGHATVPAIPTDFLDFRWTRLYIVATSTDLPGTLGIEVNPSEHNRPSRDAMRFLRDEAHRVTPLAPDILFRPLQTGDIV